MTTGHRVAEQVLLTTQPGWAFATLGELRARGLRSHVAFHHRDSSLVATAHEALLARPLLTPEDVYGLVAVAEGTARFDATERLRQLLDPDQFKQQALRWLARQQAAGGRRPLPRAQPQHYSIEVEVWGETALHRHTLANLVRHAVQSAFPSWREAPSGGVRLLCKADPRVAFLGVQLYSNLAPTSEQRRDRGTRQGTLREHLACALLVLARVHAGDDVLDPFMGTGTILRAAGRRFGVRACFGAEVDSAAFQVARRAVDASAARLVEGSFEQIDFDALPRAVKVVSNLPFGVQFTPVPTNRLLAFLVALRPRMQAMALLMSRAQAQEIAQTLRLRAKHVLVLGQPAAIVYGSG